MEYTAARRQYALCNQMMQATISRISQRILAVRAALSLIFNHRQRFCLLVIGDERNLVWGNGDLGVQRKMTNLGKWNCVLWLRSLYPHTKATIFPLALG